MDRNLPFNKHNVDVFGILLFPRAYTSLFKHKKYVSYAQHFVSAVDFVRVKNKLIVAACEELVSNGGVS